MTHSMAFFGGLRQRRAWLEELPPAPTDPSRRSLFNEKRPATELAFVRDLLNSERTLTLQDCST